MNKPTEVQRWPHEWDYQRRRDIIESKPYEWHLKTPDPLIQGQEPTWTKFRDSAAYTLSQHYGKWVDPDFRAHELETILAGRDANNKTIRLIVPPKVVWLRPEEVDFEIEPKLFEAGINPCDIK